MSFYLNHLILKFVLNQLIIISNMKVNDNKMKLFKEHLTSKYLDSMNKIDNVKIHIRMITPYW